MTDKILKKFEEELDKFKERCDNKFREFEEKFKEYNNKFREQRKQLGVDQKCYIKFNPLCEDEGIKLLFLNGIHIGFEGDIFLIPTRLCKKLKEELNIYLQEKHQSQVEPLIYINEKDKLRR